MTIKENTEKILKCLPAHVNLIAVSKTRTIDEMKECYSAGARDFGENKVQELVKKYDEFYDDVRWHLIGHLQKNKVKYIVGKVYLVHSLDSIDLLNEIEKRYKAKNLICNALIQINIGKEETKTGICEEDVDELISHIEECENVKVKGLMAIIPKGDEESCRNYFRKMKSIFDKYGRNSYKNVEMKYLSMGMTSDYNYAITEGSNMVRVGQGIFGERIYKK